MTTVTTKNLLHDIVFDIMGSADELRAKKDRTPVEQGKLIAFYSSLMTIQETLFGQEEDDEDWIKWFIDTDLDKRYIN